MPQLVLKVEKLCQVKSVGKRKGQHSRQQKQTENIQTFPTA